MLKVESSKKRPNESATKTPGPDKKAKLVTPKKTGDFSGLYTIVLFTTKDQIIAFSRLILKFCPSSLFHFLKSISILLDLSLVFLIAII